ncbi:aldo/keto reductase [Mesorhizobium sp. 1B3]|uniref:aldo/keto reductase n=1 Tax=Mesorhizobium sp. 1B3 TaxID=3243599 RepID=UPI003D98B47E
MEKRRLGRTELRIAPVVFGGNVFGWTIDEKTSFELLDRFAEAGFNAIDTADVYSRWHDGNSGGESEAIIGKWMKSRGNRDDIVVITKVGSDLGDGKKGLSAAYIETAIDASLKRLQTDVVDLYLSHWADPSVPYEETLGAYQKLIAKGKIRYAGASNLDAAQLKEALAVAQGKSLPRYEVLQPGYNLYDRAEFEGALRDLTMAEEIGVITYFSLAKGFLSGKYRSEADLGKSQRGEGVKQYLNDRGTRILAALEKVAARHDAKLAEIAVAWLIARPGVTAPIASATSLAQLESLIRAAAIGLSPEDIEELDSASA